MVLGDCSSDPALSGVKGLNSELKTQNHSLPLSPYSQKTCTHARTHARTQTHARTHTRTHAHRHRETHTQTHARTHTHTHTRMHAHTHTRCDSVLWGLSIGVMVFILYKLYFLSPKHTPYRKPFAFLYFQNTSCVIYKLVSSWGP